MIAYALACATCLGSSAGAVRPAAADGPLVVPDAVGAIVLDGRPVEAAWRHAAHLTTFYEIWPGDNVPPTVRTEVALTYDAHFLYLAVWAQDPHPGQIRAAYTERDNVTDADDYVSFALDTRGDGRSATIVRITPRGVQADGVFNDADFATGQAEDLAPDFAWDAVTAIGDSGWTAEVRIPFASLRYAGGTRQRWGLIVHRHYPRAFTYEFFSVPLPRGTACFVCHEQLVTLGALPGGAHLSAAPYVAAQAARAGAGQGATGTPTAGVDVQWVPAAGTVVDATLHPDFSQIEGDVPQIGVNAQFALLYPEKRRFFLEGADLFQTPLQAVYTRAVTAPAWGARTTGQLGRSRYTVLAARDDGGGSVVLPGPSGSTVAPQDFPSTVAIARERTSWLGAFAGVLATDREIAGSRGGGYNRLAGPDFQWNVTPADQLTGQFLVSDTRVPNRPDLTTTWDGRTLAGAAADLTWHHGDRRFEWLANYRQIGRGFRADDGFLPQVGVRRVDAWANTSFYGRGTINQVLPWLRFQRVVDLAGGLVSEWRWAGLALAGARGLTLQVRYSDERLRAAGKVLARRYVQLTLDGAPSRRLAQVHLTARYGGEVDVDNGRAGRGGEVSGSFVAHLSTHLELRGLGDVSWLDVPVAAGGARLFTARVTRVRASYNVSPRAALRLIAQQTRTARDTSLYALPATPLEGGVMLSALLTYQWSWDTVLFLGLGDERAVGDVHPAPRTQTLFFKLQMGLP